MWNLAVLSRRWHVVSSSACSVTCGRGSATQDVQCLQTQMETRTSHVVPDEACAHVPLRPADVVECVEPPCEHYIWKYDKWREVRGFGVMWSCNSTGSTRNVGV